MKTLQTAIILALFSTTIFTASCAGHYSRTRSPRGPELVKIEYNRLATFRIDILPKGHGSGILISREGHLLTAYHVIDNPEGQQISIKEPDGKTKIYPISIIAIDKVHDLAVIKIDRRFKNPAVFDKERNVDVGDAVYNIGYPHSLGEIIGRGSIMQKHWTRMKFMGSDTDFIDILICDIKDGGGTSGSAVFAWASGKIIGILTTKFRYGGSETMPPTVVIGVRSLKYIMALLEKARVPYLTRFNSKPKNYPKLKNK